MINCFHGELATVPQFTAMFGRDSFLFAGLLACGAVLFSIFNPTKSTLSTNGPKGQPNTVLFLSNYEYGLANVLLASSYALLVQHPEIRVHFASFPKREKDTTLISKYALDQNPSASPMTFHGLKGPT